MSDQRQIRIGAVALAGLGLVLALVLLVAGWGGVWAWLLLGAVLLAIAVTVFVVYARRPHRSPAEQAPRPAAADDHAHRVLVIADGSCAPGELRNALVRERSTPIEVFVVTPAVSSRLARWTGDDHAYTSAKERLDATLAAFAEFDIDAQGHVGSHDPLQAADDGMREFPAEEIVFVTAGEGAAWVEDGVVEEARVRYGIAVTEIGGRR